MKRITYNKLGTIESPTLILSSVAHKHYGVINNVDQSTISFNFNMNSSQEVSFEVYKELNGIECDLWDKIVSLRYVYIPEHDEYYKMDVTIDEGDKTVKKCTLSSASEYELGNKYINFLGINDDTDFDFEDYYYNPDQYATTVFYVPNAIAEGKQDQSLLHRLLKDFAPDWQVGVVDETLWNIQRTFTVTGQSVYDFLTNTVAKEFDCLFKFDSVNRIISAYDLLNTCTAHTPYYRGNFTNVCPKCNSSEHIIKGYGKDTGIYISYENYSENMTVDGDENNVKNCFYVTGGDDAMTAFIKLSNPNYSNFIYNFSQMDYDDMPEELVTRLEEYKTEYNDKLPEFQGYVEEYSSMLSQYYWYKTSMMPRSNSTKWQRNTQYVGNDPNARVFTSTLPAWCYLQCVETGWSGNLEFDCSSVVVDQIIVEKEPAHLPAVTWKVCKNITDTSSAEQQAGVIRSYLNNASNKILFLDNIPETDPVTVATTTVATNVKNIAALAINSFYRVETINGEPGTLSNIVRVNNKIMSATWTGKLKITSVNNADDIYIPQEAGQYFTASLKACQNRDDYLKYQNNKVAARASKDDNTYTTIFKVTDNNEFRTALTTYSLDRLTSFYQTYNDILSVLDDQHINDPNYKFHGYELYDDIYAPYVEKRNIISEEISRRQKTVNNYDTLYKAAKAKMKTVSDQLQLKNFLGDTLYKTFHSYLRIGTYQNSNYIAGDQSDALVLSDANRVMELAQEELQKACELQYTLSDSLHNLLNTDGFSNFRDDFEIGDYIICRVDDELYRLRLIQVQYTYDKPEDLAVTFSNVTKISNYFSDVQSVLNQAQTMSNSYDIVEHQVDKNTYTTTTVDDWLNNGLNTTISRVKSNVQEEVEITNTGILCRSKDDLGETYSNEQFRIQHNIMAFTSDNWNTVKTALGKSDYSVYNAQADEVQTLSGYGLQTEYVVSGYVTAGVIIGGHIYSDNYKANPATGTHFNLDNGDITVGGGKLKYDTTNGLYINGNGTFSGEISATDGNIGGWKINRTGLTYSTSTSSSNVYPTGLEFVQTSAGNTNMGGGWLDILSNANNQQSSIHYPTNHALKYTMGNYEVYIGRYDLPSSSSSSPTPTENHGVMVKNGSNYVALTRSGSVIASGSITAGGAKPRMIETESYGKRLEYCYETPTPLFGDIGEGIIDDTGVCMIYIDDIFAETANTNCDYQVFLQSYSEYNCYVSERTPFYFVVNGEPNTSFGWEIKAVQKDFETYRLDTFGADDEMETDNSINEVWNYLDDLLYDVDKEDI